MRKVERLSDKHYSIHYPSFEAAVNDIPKNVENTRLFEKYVRGREHNGDWYGKGCHSPVEFLEHVDRGWPELVKKVAEFSSTLAFKPDILPVAITSATKRRRVRSDNGNELDIHRVYQGRSDVAWSSTRHELHLQRRRMVHLFFSNGGNGFESAESSLWQAAALHRVCDIFQRNGFSVEITATGSTTGAFRDKRHMSHISFTAKSSSMPLDLNRLALQGTLGWYRVFDFAGTLCNDQGFACNYGMGRALDSLLDPKIAEREAAGDVVVKLPSGIRNEYTARAAVLAAQKVLEAEVKS